jgi:drug/metabolite transporter (DMT)-like permease
MPLELVALLGLGAAGLITRYRRGDRIERLQIRWLVSAVAITAIGFGGTAVSYALGSDGPPISTSITLVAYAGILLMPIAIGIAVTRYRLFEIDRIISRTIGWAVVTGILGAVFAGTIVGLQTILADVTQAQTLSVAASTLVAFVLFQPVRRRVQSAVDHRFNRARYDAERTAAAFAERQRDQVNLAGLKVDIAGTIDVALRPRTLAVWIRPTGRGGTP